MPYRQIVYPGQSPEDTDILLTNKYAYIGLSKLAAAVLGTGTLLNNFTCTQNSPAAMNVVISAGEIYSLENIDNTAYGSLPSDTVHTILKQGVNLDSTVVAITAPVTSGDSINYLIEIGFSESDGGSIVLPYYNSTDPEVPFAGPNDNAQPNNTVRQDTVSIIAKAGTAATTGTQTTPSPDAGFVGAYVVTVAFGATTVVTANISTYAGAPFITETLTQKISETTANSLYLSSANLQTNSTCYAADTGIANAYVMTLSPVPTSYVAGEYYYTKILHTNTSASCTLNVNSLGTKNIKLTNGSNINIGDLVVGMIAVFDYDGTNMQLLNPATWISQLTVLSYLQTNSQIYAADTGSANAYAIALANAPTSYTTGMTVLAKIANTNTGASTIAVNGLTAKNITYGNTNALIQNDLPSGMIAALHYDGTEFQLLNPPMTMQKIAVAVASSSASIAFTGLGTAYSYYMLVITGLIVSTGTEDLNLTMSANNGSSYLNSGYSFAWTGSQTGATTTTTSNGNGSTTIIELDMNGTLAQSSATEQTANYVIKIFNANTSNRCMISFEGVYVGSTGAFAQIRGGGQQFTTTGINAIQVNYAANAIASGTFELYGVYA